MAWGRDLTCRSYLGGGGVSKKGKASDTQTLEKSRQGVDLLVKKLGGKEILSRLSTGKGGCSCTRGGARVALSPRNGTCSWGRSLRGSLPFRNAPREGYQAEGVIQNVDDSKLFLVFCKGGLTKKAVEQKNHGTGCQKLKPRVGTCKRSGQKRGVGVFWGKKYV